MKEIPKVIHYFWFGHNKMPELLKKCIQSWKKYCPNYEIKKWDESNFNVNICNYVKEAYKAKKWAFVSDYARFFILNKYGGVYLDTDVELIKPIDEIIKQGPFFACENQFFDSIAPGLGMATYSDNELYSKIIQDYNNSHFILKNGLYDEKPVGKRIVDKYLLKDGLKDVKGIQQVDGINIYPHDYFCPLNFLTGKLTITNNTVAIHHYASSWWTKQDKKYARIGQRVTNIFGPVLGPKIGLKVQKYLKFPYSFRKKYKQIGIKRTIKFYINKYLKI